MKLVPLLIIASCFCVLPLRGDDPPNDKQVAQIDSAKPDKTAHPNIPGDGKGAKATAEDPHGRNQVSPLMLMKLEKAKRILEGLAVEDYDLIAKNARALKLLSLESGWNVLQTKKYAAQSRDFRRACDLIVESADEKDISRAALGYVSLTVRCVECHSYMRENKIELVRILKE